MITAGPQPSLDDADAADRPHRARRRRLLVCINPTSGLGRGAGTGAEVIARLRGARIDVEVLAVPREGARSPTQRYAVALAELLRHRPRNLSVRLEGADAERAPSGAGDLLEGPAFLLCVMNGRFIGGGMEITPGTRIDDGVLEVFHVPPLHGDGEPLGHLPATITVVRGALTALDWTVG